MTTLDQGPNPQPHNGYHPDDPGPEEPDNADSNGEPTTWEPIDLGPYLRGEIKPITPSVGASRTDEQRLLYPGLEHAVIAHTAVGKTWFSLACVTAELLADNTVVYLHFEESNPASTVERLLQIGLPADTIARRLLFAAPSRALRNGGLTALVDARPTLVIIDGVNEAMVLQGQKIDLEGWSAVRRRIVVPFKETGAAVLECDHLPLSADPLRGDGYGTVHKGNVIDGARFALVRKEPFGRGRRGVSHLYSTKDRPGYLGKAGKADDRGNVYLGTLIVDDTGTPDLLTIYAPKLNDETPTDTGQDANTAVAKAVCDVLTALPTQSVPSRRLLFAEMRKAGHQYRDQDVRPILDDLVVTGRLTEVSGKRGATGYRVTSTASQESNS